MQCSWWRRHRLWEALTSTMATIMTTLQSKDLIGRIVKNKRAARIFGQFRAALRNNYVILPHLRFILCIHMNKNIISSQSTCSVLRHHCRIQARWVDCKIMVYFQMAFSKRCCHHCEGSLWISLNVHIRCTLVSPSPAGQSSVPWFLWGWSKLSSLRLHFHEMSNHQGPCSALPLLDPDGNTLQKEYF